MTPLEDIEPIHHQWLPGELFAEPYASSPDARSLLIKITERQPWDASKLIQISAWAGARLFHD